MTRLVAVAFATMVAVPAFAQSYDPSVGSGNIAPQVVENPAPGADRALGAYARSAPPHQRDDATGRRVLPYTLKEHRALDRAKGNIW
jgi:hypothetical protein